MKFDVVNLYYPNEWRRAVGGSGGDTFSWFLCSFRALDPETGLYYLSVSPDVQFYCPSTGKSLLPRGLSTRGEGVETKMVRPRLIVLSDPHNKKRLCSMYGCSVSCDSERNVLSPECELVTDRKAVKNLATKIVKDLRFDGVAVRHECLDIALDRPDMPVCQEATFYFKDGILEDLGGDWPARCGIIRYAKKNNSCIRKVIPEFPDCQEIEETLEGYPCSIVSYVLYEYITEYMRKSKEK